MFFRGLPNHQKGGWGGLIEEIYRQISELKKIQGVPKKTPNYFHFCSLTSLFGDQISCSVLCAGTPDMSHLDHTSTVKWYSKVHYSTDSKEFQCWGKRLLQSSRILLYSQNTEAPKLFFCFQFSRFYTPCKIMKYQGRAKVEMRLKMHLKKGAVIMLLVLQFYLVGRVTCLPGLVKHQVNEEDQNDKNANNS